jgi:hypothetical protein
MRTGWLVIGCLVFFRLQTVFADGMFIRPLIDEETETTIAFIEEETHQRAFLYYDASDEIERLIIEVQTGMFSGNFAWFIPLPPAYTIPDVQVEEIPASSNVFTDLERLTAPAVVLRKYYYGDRPRGCVLGCEAYSGTDNLVLDENEETQKPDVVVWESGETASFEYTHLSSPTVPALVTWCDTNGYGQPDDSVQAVLLDYVEREWSFVLIQGTKDVETPSGGCVSITFSPAVDPVFPLAISAPGHLSLMAVDLYVVSTDYIEPGRGSPGFTVRAKVYSNPLSVRAELIENDGYPWYVDLFSSFGGFADGNAIPSAADLLAMVLSNQDLLEQRELAAGDGSWWRFFSRTLTVDELDRDVYPPVNEYLQDLLPSAGLVFTRFWRSFSLDEDLEDVFFSEAFDEVPFAGSLNVTADVYDPERASNSAGVDLSLVFGLLIWIAAKMALQIRRRRG